MSEHKQSPVSIKKASRLRCFLNLDKECCADLCFAWKTLNTHIYRDDLSEEDKFRKVTKYEPKIIKETDSITGHYVTSEVEREWEEIEVEREWEEIEVEREWKEIEVEREWEEIEIDGKKRYQLFVNTQDDPFFDDEIFGICLALEK